jgi:multiple sugar transport system substrate-binding protein
MTRKLTRREMLKLSGVLVTGSLLAACAPKETPTVAPTSTPPKPGEPTSTPVPEPTEAPPTPVEGHVVIMKTGSEFSEEEREQFSADNPGITIETVETDTTRFFAMYAAGTPPDLMRTQAPAIPQYLARKILYDLTPYYEVSGVLNLDDLAPANNYYRANSPLDIGDGPIYGMCKDWSPDFTMFIYKPAFEQAGLDPPDDTVHLTYQEVFDLARRLAVFEGDRVLMWGYGYDAAWTDRMWMNMLAELDQSLYTEAFSAINLTGSEEARAVVKYYFDLAS